MLSALAVSAALTAVFAGVAGAWSPCGFSMVDTIGSALGEARRGATLCASAAFALGTLAGGTITFGSLALLGSLFGDGLGGPRALLGAGLALLAAVADWWGVRIVPQIRRQVPERWRWTLPLPLACALYGILLGLGFTTFVLAFAVWALAGISFASGDLLVGIAVGLGFGAGRALPVLWMAPGMRGGRGARRLDEMATAPALWLGLRRLDALGLGLCALALAGASASAASTSRTSAARTVIAQTRLAGATDPSIAGGTLAWQQLGGGGLLQRAGAAPVALPGVHPALGGANVAWVEPGQIVIADSASLQPKLRLGASAVSALSVSDGWVVYRDEDAQGEHLIAVSLVDQRLRRYLAGSRLGGRIGRPALDGASAVFTVDTPRRSAIELVDLDSGHRRVLRAARHGAAFFNPSLLGGRMLFERVTRCAQQLLVAAVAPPARKSRSRDAAVARRHGRVLLSLPSAVSRDPGYEGGYTHAYNSASGCRNRHAGRGSATQLGATALGISSAYVTRLGPAAGSAEVVALGR